MQTRSRTPFAIGRPCAVAALLALLTPLTAHTAELSAASAPGAFHGAMVDDNALADARGGAETLSKMTLDGVVSNNEAYNLNTGNNTIADGSLQGASGIPMVIQNSGNNVLIQNATIVNVQMQ